MPKSHPFSRFHPVADHFSGFLAVATVYEQAGAVYGGQLDWFRRLEAKAKAAKRGMWAQDSKAYTSPAAFKAANKPK